MARWIRFAQVENPGRLTKVWQVITVEHGEFLGEVRWFTSWRKYCFFPAPSTIFEQDCLRDIADFCETVTKQHKAQ